MSELGDALNKLVYLKRVTDGSLRAKPAAAGRFIVILWKKAILMPLNHISHMFKAI